MRTYNCDGFRSVQAESIQEAAGIFGLRLSRKTFGRSATLGPVNENLVNRNGSLGEYQVFIGTYDRKDKVLVGHDEWLTIHAA